MACLGSWNGAAEKRTPDAWAQAAFPPGPRNMPHPQRWQQDAAAALHGWGDHEHHAGAPMQLTGVDYYQALVAASEPNKDGHYVPHFPALSPHSHLAKRFAAAR